MTNGIRAGLIGTGFIGGVHARATVAAGGTLRLVADATSAAAEAAVAKFRAKGHAVSAAELIASKEIDVVHICTPNVHHAELAELAIRHGKHVVCEKPLATTEPDARRITTLARDAGVVAAVPFAYRYHPMVREARARIASGEAGQMRVLHGSYLQDWLADQHMTNWRVDSTRGGASRAFADIGVHWCDLMEFTTGHRIVRLLAQLVTIPSRRGGTGSDRADTEDGANVLFETDGGAVGSIVVSQIARGRKNRLWFSFDGEYASYVFDQENSEKLWIGGPSENRTIPRGMDNLGEDAARYSKLPAGHPQGFQDCFNAFVGDVYSAIDGDEPGGLPTFADGVRASVLTSAVLQSAHTESWVKVAP